MKSACPCYISILVAFDEVVIMSYTTVGNCNQSSLMERHPWTASISLKIIESSSSIHPYSIMNVLMRDPIAF
jgi:hypothetical protein